MNFSLEITMKTDLLTLPKVKDVYITFLPSNDFKEVANKAAYSDEYKSLRKQNYELWHKVLSEDIKAVEGMQEGRNSPAYNGGNFSPVMDNPTHQFHQWVAKNLV